MIFEQPELQVQPSHAHPKESDLCVCFSDGKVLLCHEGKRLSLPSLSQLQPLSPAEFVPFELARTEDTVLVSPHPFSECVFGESGTVRYEPLHVFRSMPYHDAALLASCWHLWSWYRTNRFCGRCGAPNEPDEAERALRCPQCGRVSYPVIAPAIIVAITCANRILLARNAHGNFQHYALISGYVEVGETLEHAVRREVMEETGIRLRSIRYLGDQPWGISGSHMFAFQAEADDQQPLRIQESELSDARWFDRSELTPRTTTVSIAFELIERFRQGQL